MTHAHISACNVMFPVRQKCAHPEVIMPETRVSNTRSYTSTLLSGVFFRVCPKTSREILALQMLEHHKEKFAPTHGDGVIVTEEALRKFT